jgi:hypothetical protein
MATYELIDHIEVDASSPSSIEFTSISGDYTDLYIVASLRDTSGNAGADITFNGVSANQTRRVLTGDGSATNSTTGTSIRPVIGYTSETANSFGSLNLFIPNYAGSNPKSVSSDSVTENNGTTAFQRIMAGLWNDTAAITSIEINTISGTFLQYSSATLYGIRKHNTASAPKATGGIITYDATNDYWVHTFTASGTFTPTEDLTAEYLVIAGGGGGGATVGGGGGAGGYRCSVSGESSGGGASAESPLSLTASTGYTVTVGAGGSGATQTSQANKGATGSNSVFSTITSDGGGGGGGNTSTGNSGGSGGGNGTAGSVASGTANQGYAGGDASDTAPHYGSGGGGGAGAVGQDGVSTKAGNGGAGVSSSITGSAITRAGGGGGSSYQGDETNLGLGAAGGGDGGNFGGSSVSPTSGLPNTGGGAGGGNLTSGTAPNGGSGIVIVRYAA